MTKTKFDAIVIGGGSGGVAYAKSAASLGADILVIEKAHLGGTCVNYGCVPKKILWAAGNLQRQTHHAAAQGVTTQSQTDFSTLTAKRDAHIQDIRAAFADSLDAAGVTLLRGDATLETARSVTVDGVTYTSDKIILASGGRPTKMDIDGADLLEDSNDVLSWTTLPKSIAIVGGGYIGCEFAAIFQAMGVDVTIIHDGTHLLDTFPEALAKHGQEGLHQSGVDIVTDDSLETVCKTPSGIAYNLKSGKSGSAEVIVCAVGRTPNIAELGSFAENLKVADTGALAVNDRLETSVAGIYAVGDVADRLPLTPVATSDGTALAHMHFGTGATLPNLDLVATTTFLYPPVAFVGSLDDDLQSQGTVTALEDHVLAPSQSHDPDFYQIGTTADQITGAAIACHAAEDVIAMIAALVAAKAPVSVLHTATPVHPSFAEEFFSEEPK